MSKQSSLRTVTRGILWLLTIVFFALPYLVDVAYCEELSPSHFAQAILTGGEDVDPSESKACALLPDHQVDLTGPGYAVWTAGLQRTVVTVSPQYLPLVSLLSRSPPIF